MEPAALLLFVEDENPIILVVNEMLTEGGFEVLIARKEKDAIAEIERDAARFKAVLTDVNLGPGPTGWDVANRARELAPEIAVIYITGGNAHEWAANGVPNSILLQKPFAAAQVLTAVTTLLNTAAPTASVNLDA